MSASSIATSAHSGISNPSLNKFIPTKISNTPILKSLIISILSSVSMSECIYRTFNPFSWRYSVKSSAIFFVNVVAKILKPFFTISFASCIKSSTWVFAGLISTGGSIKPVGRIIWSINSFFVCFNSHGPGVADTNIVWVLIKSHSSNFKGLLSIHDGSLKPYSANVLFLVLSPLYIPLSCGTVTWLSSTKIIVLSGKYSNNVGGGSPGFLPDKNRE